MITSQAKKDYFNASLWKFMISDYLLDSRVRCVGLYSYNINAKRELFIFGETEIVTSKSMKNNFCFSSWVSDCLIALPLETCQTNMVKLFAKIVNTF